MAIGTPVQRYAARTLFNGTAHSISPASTVAAGTRAFIFGVAGGATFVSVADSVGNSWGTDHTHAGGTLSDPMGVASCSVVTPITTGDTITITWSPSANQNRSYYIMEVSGLATSSAFDTFADSVNPSNSQAITIGPTATLAQDDEIAFFFAEDTSGSRILTLPGWSSPATPDFDTAHLRYQIVAATTPLSISEPLAWNNATTGSRMIVTYRAETGDPNANLAPVIYGRGAA